MKGDTPLDDLSPSDDLSYIPGLDGLRALAATMVVVFHVTASSSQPVVQSVGALGRSGVDLFFVLSGFLITRILLATRGAPGALKSFYIRRALRIFPLYFLGLGLYALAVPLAYSHPPAPLAHQAWSWLFLSNIPETFHSIPGVGPPHYWSLAVEEHFYLLWPALVMTLPRRFLPTALAAIIVTAVLARIGLVAAGIEPYYLTISRMDGLAWGASLALIARPSPGLLGVLRLGVVVLPIAILALFLGFSGTGEGWIQVTKYTLTTLFFVAVLGLVFWDRRSLWATRILSTAPLTGLGRISFGLYVYHPLAFGIPMALPLPLWLRLSAGAALTVAIAFVSYRWFESPLLRLKRHWPPPRSRAASPESDSSLRRHGGGTRPSTADRTSS